eukprot:TRINITY_DN66788_c2_g19_i1.p1 TRINITY_DN66788_c2_g19~~TRINITY_DN66788_c2_g19_i1.p1  ORF type:complete len:1062 (-),score=126.82 TRINITY_DN66788_c2_g19_i1:92-2908(-)
MLANTDEDDRMLAKILKRLKEIQARARADIGDPDVLKEEVGHVQAIQSHARAQLHIRPCRDVMQNILDLLEGVLLGTPINERFAAIDDSISQLNSSIAAVDDHQRECEESGDVASVEREVTQKLRLSKKLLEKVQAKLHMLATDSSPEAIVKSVEATKEAARSSISTQTLHHETLRSSCLADIQRISHCARQRQPKITALKDKLIQKQQEFETALAENDKAHHSAWIALENSVASVVKASEVREQLVRSHLSMQMVGSRDKQAHEAFENCTTAQISQLKNMCGTCDLVGRVYAMLSDFVTGATNLIDTRLSQRNKEIEYTNLTLHREFFNQFSAWFLTQGEYTHKKKLVLKDIHKQIEQVHEKKRIAVERLDTLASVHAETAQKLERQRSHLEELVPYLENEQEQALQMFKPTEDYFVKNKLEFVHPVEELNKRNHDREREMQTRELAQSQELVMSLQQALLEYEHKTPTEEALMNKANADETLSNISEPTVLAPQSTSVVGGGSSETANWDMSAFKKKLQEEMIIIPHDYLDPITMEIMEDPVTAADGHTYDRNSILRWFTKRKTSPVTNKTLTSTDLVHNTALGDKVEKWKQEQCDNLKLPLPARSQRSQFTSSVVTRSTHSPSISGASTPLSFSTQQPSQHASSPVNTPTPASPSRSSSTAALTSHQRHPTPTTAQRLQHAENKVTTRMYTPRSHTSTPTAVSSPSASVRHNSSDTRTVGATSASVPTWRSNTPPRSAPTSSTGGESPTPTTTNTSYHRESYSSTPTSAAASRDRIIQTRKSSTGTTTRHRTSSGHTTPTHHVTRESTGGTGSQKTTRLRKKYTTSTTTGSGYSTASNSSTNSSSSTTPTQDYSHEILHAMATAHSDTSASNRQMTQIHSSVPRYLSVAKDTTTTTTRESAHHAPSPTTGTYFSGSAAYCVDDVSSSSSSDNDCA